MSWKDKVDELKKRQEWARKLGGEQSISYQHKLGKLTVRERIEAAARPGVLFRTGDDRREGRL